MPRVKYCGDRGCNQVINFSSRYCTKHQQNRHTNKETQDKNKRYN